MEASADKAMGSPTLPLCVRSCFCINEIQQTGEAGWAEGVTSPVAGGSISAVVSSRLCEEGRKGWDGWFGEGCGEG